MSLFFHSDITDHSTLPLAYFLLIAVIFLLVLVALAVGVLVVGILVEATTCPSEGFGDVIAISRHHQRHQQQRAASQYRPTIWAYALRLVGHTQIGRTIIPTSVFQAGVGSGGSMTTTTSSTGRIRIHVS